MNEDIAIIASSPIRTSRGSNPAPLKQGAEGVSPEGLGKRGLIQVGVDNDKTMGKMAESVTVGGGSSHVKMMPRIYSPLFEQSNLQLPRDRRTLNAWARFHFETNPWVKNAVTLHSTFPISKWNITCSDYKIEQECIDIFDEIDFTNIILGVASEIWKLGECFPYGSWDEDEKCWSKFVIFNPDYIHVTANVLSSDPIITMQPDDQLRRIIQSNNASDMELRSQLPPDIVERVRRGENIPLNNFFVSHLKLLSAPYDLRGTSIVVAAFKDLMLYDILREAEYAQASDMINPVTLIKLGDPNGNWKPTNEDIKKMASAWEEGLYDQNFKIVTHGAVTVEKIGNSGSIVDTAGRIDRIEKNILTAMFTPMGVMHGEGPTYATSSVGLEVLKVRYNNFRTQIENWVEKKVLLPMAKARGWTKHEHGEKRYIIPRVIWNKMNLRELESYMSTMIQLAGEGGGTGSVSMQTVLETLDLDYDEEKRRKKREMIDAAISERHIMGLQGMTAKEMESLNEDSEIPEPDPDALAAAQQGQDGMSGMPGGDMGDLGGGLGGIGGGEGMAGMGDLGGGAGEALLGGGEAGPAPAGGEGAPL